MDRTQFEQIGTELFGGNRWGSKMAEATGLSTALVSNIRNGRVEVTEKTEQKVLKLYESHKGGKDGDAVSFEGTRLCGEAAFRLELVARDLVGNRFVKVKEVNPALFFPAYAPQAQAPVSFKQAKAPAQVQDDDENLADEDILGRIEKRVRVMDRIASGVINNEVPSMIVYGGPGVGKSYTIMKALEETEAENPEFHYDVIKGAARAPGLYKALFAARNGGVVVLDDSDSIFQDEDALNLLKAALDSSETRRISWRKESSWLVELASSEGVDMDEVRDFEFKGGVIFITNLNLRERAENGHRMADHYGALISRSFYVDLTIDSPRAKALRVRQVFLNGGMARQMGLNEEEAQEIADFIQENRFRLSEVSLRMASLVVKVFLSDPEDWKEIIEVTKMV